MATYIVLANYTDQGIRSCQRVPQTGGGFRATLREVWVPS